jgi:hypothetical protein
MAADTSEIDALFRLPVTEFTAARNALAVRLKKAGQADAAAQVKALPKPPVSAWAVNQLYWNDRKAFDQLLAAGERLLKTQASQLRGAGSPRRTPASWGAKGGDMREALEARRAAIAELTKRASALLQEAGHTPSPDLMRRITTTLDALATYGSRPDSPRAGRLTNDVDAPGFEALTSLIPRKGAGARGGEPTRVIPFQQPSTPKSGRQKLDPAAEERRREAERKAHAAAAEKALHAAERALSDARTTAARAEAALKTVAARAKKAEQTKDALNERLEKAAAEVDHTRQEARRVAAEAEEAAQAVEDAERALEAARRMNQALTD